MCGDHSHGGVYLRRFSRAVPERNRVLVPIAPKKTAHVSTVPKGKPEKEELQGTLGHGGSVHMEDSD